MSSGPYISAMDAQAYGEYAYFCGASGTRPWTLPQWLLMTERDAAFHFDVWVTRTNHDKNAPLPNDAASHDEMVNAGEERLGASDARTVRAHALSPADSQKLADLRQQATEGQRLRVGYVHANGELRSKPAADSFEGQAVRRERHATSKGSNTLTARTCRKCSDVLPAHRFSKQRNGTRAICKACDGARRRGKVTPERNETKSRAERAQKGE